MKKDFQNIDQYISEFSVDVVSILNNIRKCIRNAAPKAAKTISYNKPAYIYDYRILIYVAAFKNHLGFYGVPSGNAVFQEQLSTYKTGNGFI